MPHKIFTSYSHVDYKHKVELDKHLAPLLLQGRLEAWSDVNIRAGAPLYEAISDNIRTANTILMLISADYVSSKSCQDEMAIALERSYNKEAVAIPIVVRACDWIGLPIGKLLSANRDGKPINSADDHDVAWYEVVKSIKQILNDWDILIASNEPVESALERSTLSDAMADELAIQPTNNGNSVRHWVYRKDENEDDWLEAKTIILESLNLASDRDPESNMSLQARRWGEKIIVDCNVPKYHNPLRLLIADIGGNTGYPGYQLTVYPREKNVQFPSERVRWLRTEDGSRMLKRLGTGGGDEFTPAEYAKHLWTAIKSIA